MHLAALLLLAGSASAQSLDLGPVERPAVNTGNALGVHFMAELEASASDRERALVRLAAALARTGEARDELVARTIDRHLDTLREVLREAEGILQDPGEEPVRRQRMRELLARIDRIAMEVDGVDAAERRRLTERLLGAVAQLAGEVTGTGVLLPARLERTRSDEAVAVEELLSRIGGLDESIGPSADRLVSLTRLFSELRSVPSVEDAAAGHLSGVAGVVDFFELPAEGYIVRLASGRLPDALARCLFERDGAARSPADAGLMLGVLARIGVIVERCGALEGDTARRIEPVLGALLGRLEEPGDAELVNQVLLPIERSVGLIVRGAKLPAPSGVSPQLQYAWRFLLPEEQRARVAAIEAIGLIPTDPERVASPDVVSALVGHAEYVESLEALLGVDALQRELEASRLPGAAGALDMLRSDLRQMGDRRGYREAGARVLPIVRTMSRYRELPGADVVLAARADEPAWAAVLRDQLAGDLETLRVRLAMQMIVEASGGAMEGDAERLDARESLETLRRGVLLGADLLTLDSRARDALDALPEFAWFAGDGAIGLSAVVGLDRAGAAIGEATAALASDDAQRASVVLAGVEAEATMIGVLAELARRLSEGSGSGASADAMEAALAMRRVEGLGHAGAALVELSLCGRYRAAGLDERALRRYALEQAERAIAELDWLRAVWQRRR